MNSLNPTPAVAAVAADPARFAPRVTVATIVERDGVFLFVEERIPDSANPAGFKLRINQPAGHLEPNESLVQAAARETLEETGWQIEITDLVCIDQLHTPDRDFLRFSFAARPLQHFPERDLDVGIVRALWLSPEQLLSQHGSVLRSELVQSSLAAYLSGQRIALHTLGRVVKTEHSRDAKPDAATQ